MKLDRNINGTRRGKYGLVKTRTLMDVIMTVREEGDDNEASMVKLRLAMKVRSANELLEETGILDWGAAGTESEFFVIKLRDRHSHKALSAYSRSVRDHTDDVEYAEEVLTLAHRSGPYSPFCKSPD
ncbi:hypothetical protein J4G48_0015130 [Bradyrhizobium barranii subsp. apii]|uniref:hypothetical protein n=1 Tax=Bradyrhizobium barranii TaxID=2992140 RepID=UPI001AA0E53C|nr:hypothetical protein [Bradyrhizobium barranii]UPT99297.1 hypothetical protein J4G48_0015130 [Bradyrhizobium barranii subsp. apii]